MDLQTLRRLRKVAGGPPSLIKLFYENGVVTKMMNVSHTWGNVEADFYDHIAVVKYRSSMQICGPKKGTNFNKNSSKRGRNKPNNVCISPMVIVMMLRIFDFNKKRP